MIPLEDTTGDIIGKAQRGLGITNDALVQRTGITPAQLRSLKAGEFIEVALRKVAPVLGLGAEQLVALGRGAWYPEQPPLPHGFAMFTTPYGGLTVNSYLVWDPATRKAVAFDTGADAASMLAATKKERLEIELVLLTHAHTDHVMALDDLLKATGAVAWINAREGDEEDFPQKGVETFATGQSFVLGPLRIETRLTSGHSTGQTTYVIKGLERPLAVVGDSLFAGSMGGGTVSYSDQLRNNLEQILALADDTILAPGHGPLTTVGQEKENNPFFASVLQAKKR